MTHTIGKPHNLYATNQQHTYNEQEMPIQTVEHTSSDTSIDSSGHKCVKIKLSRKAVNILSSSQINQAGLIDPDIIIKRYANYHTLSRISTLAQRLVSKSYFGDDVLKKCTVMGCQDHPALPLKELNDLKQKIFSLFLSSGLTQSSLKTPVQIVLMPSVSAVKEIKEKSIIMYENFYLSVYLIFNISFYYVYKINNMPKYSYQ